MTKALADRRRCIGIPAVGLLVIVLSLGPLFSSGASAKGALCTDPQKVEKLRVGWSALDWPDMPKTEYDEDPTTARPGYRSPLLDAGADPSLLIASDGTTVMRSLDGGCSWHEVWRIPAIPSVEFPFFWRTGVIRKIEMPTERLIYMVVETATYAAPNVSDVNTKVNHLVVSRDGGQTWDATASAPNSHGWWAFEASERDPMTAYYAVKNHETCHLFVTHDGWATSDDVGWSDRLVKAASDPTNSQFWNCPSAFEIDPLDPKTVLVPGVSGLRLSTDGARTWRFFPEFPTVVTGGAVHRKPGQSLQILASIGDCFFNVQCKTSNTLAISQDAGGSWREIPTPPNASGISSAFFGSKPGSLIGSASDPSPGSVASGLWRFDPRAQRWVDLAPGMGLKDLVMSEVYENVGYALSSEGNGGRTVILRYIGRL